MDKTREEAERAWKTMDFIKAHPAQHDQAYWVRPSDYDVWQVDAWDAWLAGIGGPITLADAEGDCGTTACFAGWTVLLAGRAVIGAKVLADSGWPTPVHGVAADLLGLDEDEADDLFFVSQTIEDLEDAVLDIFGPRPEPVAS